MSAGKPPNISRLDLSRLEDISEKDANTLGGPINDFMSSVHGLFSGGIRVDGHMGSVGTFDVAIPDDWQNMTLVNSWANVGAGFNNAQYRKGQDGRVYLRGGISLGSAPSTVTTLPAGYRPALTHLFPIISSDRPGQVRVFNTGNVDITAMNVRESGVDTSQYTNPNNGLGLDSVSFDAADRTPIPLSCWPVKLKVPFKPLSVLGCTAENLDRTKSPLRVGSFWLDWEWRNEAGVYIRNALGLAPNNRYRITYAALKG